MAAVNEIELPRRVSASLATEEDEAFIYSSLAPRSLLRGGGLVFW